MADAGSVAIVGGGVAGLSAAAFLSRMGLKVHLFEANPKIGGCCATTDVSGYTFNDGALYLALPALLDHVFRRIGLDRPSEVPLRQISGGQTTYLPDGTVVSLGPGPDVNVHGGHQRRRGRLREELDAFMRDWEPVLRFLEDDVLLRPFSPVRLVAEGWPHLHKLRGTVASELRSRFGDAAVRAAVSGALLYAGVPPQRMPALLLIGVVALLREGIFLPEGGMGTIPAALGRAVRNHGGEIHLSSPVTRVVVRDGRVAGVETPPMGLVEVGSVISTVSAMHTFGTLMDPRAVPPFLRRKVRRAGLSHKGYVLQLGLRNRIDVPSHCINVLPWMEDQATVFEPGEGDDLVPLIYTVPTLTMPELAPPNCSIIETYPAIPQDRPPSEWGESLKEEVAERAIASLRSAFDLEVAATRVLSPREFQESMRLYEGALYGLSPVAGPGALFRHRSPLPGLYQAGQTTWPGFGVGAAAVSGILAAEALLTTRAKRRGWIARWRSRRSQPARRSPSGATGDVRPSGPVASPARMAPPAGP